MNYFFSKELVDSGSSIWCEQLRTYTIKNLQDELAGQMFYYRNKQIIEYGNQAVEIKRLAKLFKKPKYPLIDLNSHQQIGELEICGGFGISAFWKDAPSDPIGKIKLGESEFNFRRVQPDVPYSFFKQATWGYFKFVLYAVKGKELYSYSLKMDRPIFDMQPSLRYKSFTGTIESNGNNMLALLTAFYLMEAEFLNEDR